MFPSSTEDHINIQYFVLNGKIFSISDAFWEKECLFKSIQLRAIKKKTLRPLFMAGVQLCQDYRATTRRQLTFYD